MCKQVITPTPQKMPAMMCDKSVSKTDRKSVETMGLSSSVVHLERVAQSKRGAELQAAESKMLSFSLGATRMGRIRKENISGTASAKEEK